MECANVIVSIAFRLNARLKVSAIREALNRLFEVSIAFRLNARLKGQSLQAPSALAA